jgi:hypothetical protein
MTIIGTLYLVEHVNRGLNDEHCLVRQRVAGNLRGHREVFAALRRYCAQNGGWNATAGQFRGIEMRWRNVPGRPPHRAAV